MKKKWCASKYTRISFSTAYRSTRLSVAQPPLHCLLSGTCTLKSNMHIVETKRCRTGFETGLTSALYSNQTSSRRVRGINMIKTVRNCHNAKPPKNDTHVTGTVHSLKALKEMFERPLLRIMNNKLPRLCGLWFLIARVCVQPTTLMRNGNRTITEHKLCCGKSNSLTTHCFENVRVRIVVSELFITGELQTHLKYGTLWSWHNMRGK